VGEELAGVGEEAAGEGENRRMTAGINTGGGLTDGGQKRSIRRKKKASGVMGRPI
jgi:hypothetical protein